MKEFIEKYKADFTSMAGQIEATDQKGNLLAFSQAVENAVDRISDIQKKNKKILMIGNGGSAGIASHQAVDYWKNGGIRALAFNDASLLTCISNDLGYENVFSAPIGQFADKDDLVVCISSSGKSKNILKAAEQAKASGCGILTLSGFGNDNPLRKLGDLNFYVPSGSYGYVEILHLFILHTILDAKLYCKDGVDVYKGNAKL